MSDTLDAIVVALATFTPCPAVNSQELPAVTNPEAPDPVLPAGRSLYLEVFINDVSTKLIGNSETPARKINVDVVNGVVTLGGAVETATAKEEAERVAKTTDGVKRVRNLLKVV